MLPSQEFKEFWEKQGIIPPSDDEDEFPIDPEKLDECLRKKPVQYPFETEC